MITQLLCTADTILSFLQSSPSLQVGSQSTNHRLLCLCNHLTSFGGGLLVAPNPIDMDTVFKELTRLDETGNFGFLLTIIFVFLLYVIAIILAKRADGRDQSKVGDEKLEKYLRILKPFIVLDSANESFSKPTSDTTRQSKEYLRLLRSVFN